MIGNDADSKRSYMLVHQTLRRLCASSVMITNNDASVFPNIKHKVPSDPVRSLSFCIYICAEVPIGERSLGHGADLRCAALVVGESVTFCEIARAAGAHEV